MRQGIGSHQSAVMKNDEWLTPPEIVNSLGEFDLDPCSPINRPWDTAKKHYHELDDGLSQDWEGRVWCNPPYGLEAKKWLKKMAEHQSGTALVFARLETSMFFDSVWDYIHSYFVIKGRLHFYHVDGTRAKHNSGAPSVLLSYNEFDSEMLAKSGIEGIHLPVAPELFILSFEKEERSWKIIVGETIQELSGKAHLDDIYDQVVQVAPKKVAKNKHFKAKVRQTLYRHFSRSEDKWLA